MAKSKCEKTATQILRFIVYAFYHSIICGLKICRKIEVIAFLCCWFQRRRSNQINLIWWWWENAKKIRSFFYVEWKKKKTMTKIKPSRSSVNLVCLPVIALRSSEHATAATITKRWYSFYYVYIVFFLSLFIWIWNYSCRKKN